MLIAELIKQDFRKNFRSQAFYRGLAVKILMGSMTLYFAVIFFMLGLFLGDLLNEMDDKLTPLEVFNGASLYILLGALLLRFFMQSLNTINLPAYQTLPIKRGTLVKFILLKPLFNVSNYLTLLVIVPFAIRSIPAWHSGWIALQFVINCILLIWMNIWLSSYLKRKFGSSFKALIIILILVVGLIAMEYFKIFSLYNYSLKIFNFLVITPFGWIVTLVLAGMAYMLNLKFFAGNYYPEKFNEKLNRGENKVVGGFTFLEKYGTIGEIIQLQIRLIFRHKRTKSLILLSLIFMLYGLLFYTQVTYSESIFMLIFCALIVTGMTTITYGQWVMSWESGYFDAILTKNIPAKTYIKANFYLLIAFNIISYILTSPYILLGVNFFYLQTAMFLYNTGVNIFLLIFTATFNVKRIDLMAKSTFNYQGTTYKSFLIIFPIMFLPALIVAILKPFLTFNQIMLIMGLLGIVGIILLPLQIKQSTKQFNRRKYAMAEGFREKE